MDNPEVEYGRSTLPQGIRSRLVPGVNGLTMHILEAGFADSSPRPLIVLLHGFPELAYSWRKIMLPLAESGFHVVAPDQRGYGRTLGWDSNFDGDVASFRMLNLAKDVLALVYRLGYRHTAAVIGHDFGSPLAGYCALLRPDVFTSLVLMSAPFRGAPALPSGDTLEVGSGGGARASIHDALAALPQPRKHYQWYFSTREANADLLAAPQGVAAFLRAYYHGKSADWAGNAPHPLTAWSATELAELPDYYVMPLYSTMPVAVAAMHPEPGATCAWLTDDELDVYVSEFQRNGFQGGLNWYRCSATPALSADLQVFSDLPVEVPSCFIGGTRDWGVHQTPGGLEGMRQVCTGLQGIHLVEAAGHWVQQEQPQVVLRHLLEFMNR